MRRGRRSSSASSWSHRRSLNHRRIVRSDGGRARRASSLERMSLITSAGAAPAANRRSASRRIPGHAYDPGRGRGGDVGRTLRRCASSARSRCCVMHPAAFHRCMSVAAKSRPDRRRRKSVSRCAAHSQTLTPCVRCSTFRSPSPRPPQIKHGGRLPSRSPLYSDRATARLSSPIVSRRYAHPCHLRHGSVPFSHILAQSVGRVALASWPGIRPFGAGPSGRATAASQLSRERCPPSHPCVVHFTCRPRTSPIPARRASAEPRGERGGPTGRALVGQVAM